MLRSKDSLRTPSYRMGGAKKAYPIFRGAGKWEVVHQQMARLACKPKDQAWTHSSINLEVSQPSDVICRCTYVCNIPDHNKKAELRCADNSKRLAASLVSCALSGKLYSDPLAQGKLS